MVPSGSIGILAIWQLAYTICTLGGTWAQVLAEVGTIVWLALSALVV